MNSEHSTPSFQRGIRRYYKKIEQPDTQSSYFSIWNAADNLFREELGCDEDTWTAMRNQSAGRDLFQSLGFPTEAEYDQHQEQAIEKFAVLPLSLLGPYVESRSRTIDELSAELTHEATEERMVGSRDVELWYATAIAGITRIIKSSHTTRCLSRSDKDNSVRCHKSPACPLKVVRDHIVYDTAAFRNHIVEYVPDPEHHAHIVMGKISAGLAAGVLSQHEKDVVTQQCRDNIKRQFGLRL